MSCGQASPRAVEGLWGEDTSCSWVRCSSPRGCRGAAGAEELSRRALRLEEGLNKLQPEDEADWTGLGDSWAGGALIAVRPRDIEGRGDRRRPGEP